VPKKESEDRWIILDFSFGEFEESVNGHIDNLGLLFMKSY
jgi:hypothetical protein